MVAVDGKSFGEEVGWVEDGAEVWEDKHALGDSIPEPIPAKIHRLGLLMFDSIMGKPDGALIVAIDGGRGWGVWLGGSKIVELILKILF